PARRLARAGTRAPADRHAHRGARTGQGRPRAHRWPHELPVGGGRVTTPSAPNQATVRIVNGPLVAPVLSRVVGMLAARAQCPVDRLDDALLVADAIAAHPQAHSADGHVTVRLAAGPEGIEMSVGELGKGGADGLLADAS